LQVRLQRGYRMLTLQSCVELCNHTEVPMVVSSEKHLDDVRLVLRPGSSLPLPLNLTERGTKDAITRLMLRPEGAKEYAWAKLIPWPNRGNAYCLVCTLDKREGRHQSGMDDPESRWLLLVKVDEVAVPLVTDQMASQPAAGKGSQRSRVVLKVFNLPKSETMLEMWTGAPHLHRECTPRRVRFCHSGFIAIQVPSFTKWTMMRTRKMPVEVFSSCDTPWPGLVALSTCLS
jgi:hypothetical protein